MELNAEELDIIAELLALELHDISMGQGIGKNSHEPKILAVRNKILIEYHHVCGHDLPDKCDIGSRGL